MLKISDKTPEEIIKIVHKYVEGTFFKRYPHLKESTSVIIVSSLAEGLHDTLSDVDVKFVFPEEILEQHRKEFLDYEQELAQKEETLQLIFRDTYEGLKRLSENWDNDMLLRELAQGTVIHDHQEKLKPLLEKLKWYPPEVYREKVKWLFSHIIFQIDHFYTIAVIRQDPLFCMIAKTRLLEIFMGITFLLNNQYPQGKKLYLFYQHLPDVPEGLRAIVEELLREPNGERGLELARNARVLIEEELLKRGMIPKESDKYWLQRKANYTFHFPIVPL